MKVVDTTRSTVSRARLRPIDWNPNGTVKLLKGEFEVQFNPSSLKVTYANQVNTNDQSTGSAVQYVGRGSSKLSLELIYDVSGENATDTTDVRQMTKPIAQLMATEPEKKGKETRYKVSGVRFQWGTFIFDGIIESMDETLDLWSENGQPLRATIALGLSQPGIHFEIGPNDNKDATQAPASSVGGATPTGTIPLQSARQGDSMQSMVARAGMKTDWKTIAERNGIEDPRHLPAGTLVDMQP